MDWLSLSVCGGKKCALSLRESMAFAERRRHLPVNDFFCVRYSTEMTMKPTRLLIFCAAFAIPTISAADDAASTFQGRVLPVLKANCVKCHGRGETESENQLIRHAQPGPTGCGTATLVPR